MYPYGQPFGRPTMPPGFPGIPGVSGMGMPPGFGMPPGTGPPGAPGLPPPPGVSGAPPGTAQANMPTRPGMPGFVPPANLPNINFNAPIIRLGTSVTRQNPVPSSSSASKSGAGSSQGFSRDAAADLAPPSVEEQLKTVFVGSIPKDLEDEWIERILKSVAPLKKWTRATNENGELCKFGFAEYEDPEGLGCAIEALKDLEVPAIDEHLEPKKLTVVIDDNSVTYIENYEERVDPQQLRNRRESARAALAATLTEYKDPSKRAPKVSESSKTPAPEKTSETPAPDGVDATPQPEIVTIPLSADDELSDIPADMRDMVAKEIAAFRERSNRRDLERLKREEEIEKMERDRNHGPRINRLASSPPPLAPTGPSGGANAIPIGPSRLRDHSGTPGASTKIPTGPSSGSQLPRDYHKGVAFVNGGANGLSYSKEEEDSDASDEELEKRRKAKKKADQEKTFLDHERRWLNRERARTSALEREQARDLEDEEREKLDKIAMGKRLAEWDDDVEAEKKNEEYYVDRSMWIRNRAAFRNREIEMDERDRQAEARQAEMDIDKKRAAESMADSFLARQAEEMEKAAQIKEPQKFKLALGAAASKKQEQGPRRKTAAEVEGMLEDEEEDESKTKRVLVPIQYDSTSVMDEETREKLVRQLAQEIPSDRKGLFEWKLQWDHIDEAILNEKLQPFVEKKIVEYLGVQEQELINFVLDHIRKRGTAGDLVKELEMALDEDSETLVKKVWRMVIFYSESEKRGLN
ncbi:hypothetical protein HOY82DRAFT_504948 [Tuber indicum]|nr:hypothetical protein HOY82DRAFT_504948 [Tuber indicum]